MTSIRGRPSSSSGMGSMPATRPTRRPTPAGRRAARAPRRRRRPACASPPCPRRRARPSRAARLPRRRGGRRARRRGGARRPTPAATAAPSGRRSRSCGPSAGRGPCPGSARRWARRARSRPSRPCRRLPISSGVRRSAGTSRSQTQRSVGSSPPYAPAVALPARRAGRGSCCLDGVDVGAPFEADARARRATVVAQRRHTALGQAGDRRARGRLGVALGRPAERCAARRGSGRP